MDEWRRKEKRKERAKHKQAKSKATVEDDTASSNNSDTWKHKDPKPLIREIQKLQVIEIEGKMTPILRIRKNNLMEKFNKIRSAKVTAGLPVPEIPDLDYDSLKRQIVREAKAKRRGESQEGSKDILDEYDDGELPDLPLGIAPPHELVAHLILHERFPSEKFSITSQPIPERESGGKDPFELAHPAENRNLMTMLQVKEKAYEIEQKALEKSPLPTSKGVPTNALVADYDEDEEEEEERDALKILQEASSEAVTSSEPVLRNLQKELVSMVPASLLRKKLKK